MEDGDAGTVRQACAEWAACSEPWVDALDNELGARLGGEGAGRRPGGPWEVLEEAEALCVDVGACPAHEPWHDFKGKAPESPVDVRVAKALGSKGYDAVRLTAISQGEGGIGGGVGFEYSQRFKHRWTKYWLESTMVKVKPGKEKKVEVGNSTVALSLPKQGAGVKGVFIGDPCFSSKYVNCLHAGGYDTLKRMTTLLNLVGQDPQMSFWSLLGDNFYDKKGVLSRSFMDRLTLDIKQKVLLTVPGNHDYWVHGLPSLQTPGDQFGLGFMQYYGQDTMSSLNTSRPNQEYLDFSTHASDHLFPLKLRQPIPHHKNYFFYNMVGNIGFLGYSGAHKWLHTEQDFQEGCRWFAEQKGLDVVMLLTHWNAQDSGCSNGMAGIDVHKKMLELPECKPLASKLKYFVGHTHCNMISEQGVGFMLGGFGMMGTLNCGNFGLPIVDTTGGHIRVLYFPIQNTHTSSDQAEANFNNLTSCITDHGFGGCEHLAEVWMDDRIP